MVASGRWELEIREALGKWLLFFVLTLYFYLILKTLSAYYAIHIYIYIYIDIDIDIDTGIDIYIERGSTNTKHIPGTNSFLLHKG